MIKRISILFLTLVFSLGLKAQEVRLQENPDGGFLVDASVNGVGIRTFYTDESWFVTLSSTTYLFLYENGYVQDSDVKGMTTLKMPDGSTTKAASFLIRFLRIGDRIVVKDIPAFVIKKQTVPMILGSSALSSLGEITREGNRIFIGDVPEYSSTTLIDPLDSLKEVAQTALEAGEYERALDSFKAVREQEPLTMMTGYQYAMLLGMLEKDEENVSFSNEWLAEHEGKSLTMDYWIFNGIGTSCAKLKDNQAAIEAYEKAVAAYYRLFNTSEKEIRKGDFHDETLGATLYSLGVVYAAEGKVARMESCFSLAAKCGNTSAAEFCQKYHIR